MVGLNLWYPNKAFKIRDIWRGVGPGDGVCVLWRALSMWTVCSSEHVPVCSSEVLEQS